VDLALAVQTLGLTKDDAAVAAFRQRQLEGSHSTERDIVGFSGTSFVRDFQPARQLLAVVDEVASFAAFSPTPLTEDQREQLTRTLADASGGEPPTLTGTDWERALTRACSFLSEPQRAGLQIKVQQAWTAKLLSQFYGLPSAR
jgi:hypothetical protein